MLATLLAAAAHAADTRPTAAVLAPVVSGIYGDAAQILEEAIRDTVIASGRFRVQETADARYVIASTARRAESYSWITVRLMEKDEVLAIARGSCDCDLRALVELAEQLVARVLAPLPAARAPRRR